MNYDLCIRLSEEPEIKETIVIAKKLGWNGIGILTTQKKISGLRKLFSKERNLDIVFGVCLKPKNTRDVRRMASKLRKKAEIITLESPNLDVSRTALEIPEVDILFLPWNEGNSMNYIMARLASKNNVSIAFNFNELLYSYDRSRTITFSNMLSVARLVRKFKSPFVITSGAKSPWDMRSPADLISFGRVLGFKDPDIKRAISDTIAKENRKRLSDNWIMPGVEVEEQK